MLELNKNNKLNFGGTQVVKAIEDKINSLEVIEYATVATDKQVTLVKSILMQKVYEVEVPKAIIGKLKVLSSKQITDIINVLNGVSYISQREMLGELLRQFKRNEHPQYNALLQEAKKIYYKIDWFRANQSVVNSYNGMLGCTEIQASQIVSLARHMEVQIALKSMYDIDTMAYEYRPTANTMVGESFGTRRDLSYKQDKQGLLNEIMSKISREDADSFIQDHRGYANALMLNGEQINRLRSLYLQLGDVEGTRPSHLYSIKANDFKTYERALKEELSKTKQGQYQRESVLIKAIREQFQGTREEYFQAKHHSVKLDTETELTNFIHNLFAMCGERADQGLLALPFHSKEFRKGVREKIKQAKQLGSFSYEAIDNLSEEAINILYPELI